MRLPLQRLLSQQATELIHGLLVMNVPMFHITSFDCTTSLTMNIAQSAPTSAQLFTSLLQSHWAGSVTCQLLVWSITSSTMSYRAAFIQMLTCSTWLNKLPSRMLHTACLKPLPAASRFLAGHCSAGDVVRVLSSST
jgi:hypothetical protein